MKANVNYKNVGQKKTDVDRIMMAERNKLNFLPLVQNFQQPLDYIQGNKTLSQSDTKGNIENFIGIAQVPIGLAGPLTVNGSKMQSDFFFPLATTEGALVASYNRGMKACTLAGGINSYCIQEGIQRSPYFKFESLAQTLQFDKWVKQQMHAFHNIIEQTSNYAQLIGLNSNLEGNSIILNLEYTTGDAAGQNMVTICTDRICKYILGTCPDQPTEWYIESNFSGDKKATALAFNTVRGKKVIAEVILPKEIINSVLKSSPKKLEAYWKASTLAVVQSGAIGAQGHIANGLTALFIACGQDVACVAESSIGITRMEVNKKGDLYASLTLPALMVGTVGGGTKLPTQKECLEILDCYGEGKAKKFAELTAALCLAGELSIAAALSVDHFTTAHEKLGR